MNFLLQILTRQCYYIRKTAKHNFTLTEICYNTIFYVYFLFSD